MDPRKIFRRFLVPRRLASGYWYLRHGARVSPRAEVELSPDLTLGRGVVVGSFTKIKAADGSLVIGARTHIAVHVSISAGHGGVAIGEDCLIGPGVRILATGYDYTRMDVPMARQKGNSRGIRIGRDVWLGAGVVVLDGAVIGPHSVLTPNAVVRGDVPAGAVCEGNPARVVFQRR